MLEELIQYLRDNRIAAALTTIAALMAVIGGVYAFIEKSVALYEILFPRKVSPRDILVHAELADSLMKKRETIHAGETFKWTYERGAELVLSLSSRSRLKLSGLSAEISGNARFEGKPSEFFDDGGTPKPSYPPYLWHSRQDVELQQGRLPHKVGTFRWDREQGIFWARLKVIAPDLRENAEFFVALREPYPEGRSNSP